MIHIQTLGVLPGGDPFLLITLTNTQGRSASFLNYGGILFSLEAPDAQGVSADVIVGFDNPWEYVYRNGAYMGAIIGRYGNRISQGRFMLDGHTYFVPKNLGGVVHLHGGVSGFDKKVWEITETQDNAFSLSYLSKDGEEGYPGTLRVKVSYTWTDLDELIIDYWAQVADRPTVLNLTGHPYFNLSGDISQGILDHQLRIQADAITLVDSDCIPTGAIVSVENSPFDFRLPATIGERIVLPHEQLKFGNGFDHNFVLKDDVHHAAHLTDPKSGRSMDVLTSEPAVQLYTGNWLSDTYINKDGRKMFPRCALCLETQHFPDSPHHAHFPATVLRPGETYKSRTIYRFR